MDLLKQIFAPTAATTETTTEMTKTEAKVVQTTATEELARDASVKKEGETYVKEVQCQPQKEIERIREVEIEKVQPVVHIDREQTEVRQVVQPILEKEVRPTLVTKTTKEVELGTRQEKASGLPTPLEQGRNLGVAPDIKSRTEFLGVEKQRQELKPIVEETIHKKIIEQVTPVVEREVVVPHVIEQTKHIHENIQEAKVVTHEIRPPITAEQWQKQEGAVCQVPSQKS
jgi:transcriptional regulator with PAS, ATPase and Fis domain